MLLKYIYFYNENHFKIKVLIFDFAFSGEQRSNSVEASAIFFGLTLLGLICALFMKENLVRSKKEFIHESIRQSVISHRKSQMSHTASHLNDQHFLKH